MSWFKVDECEYYNADDFMKLYVKEKTDGKFAVVGLLREKDENNEHIIICLSELYIKEFDAIRQLDLMMRNLIGY